MNIPIWVWIVSLVWLIAITIWIIYTVIFSKAKKQSEEILEMIYVSKKKIESEKILKRAKELEEYKVTNSLNEFISNEINPSVVSYKETFQRLLNQLQELEVKFESKKVFKLSIVLETLRSEFKTLQIESEKLSKKIKKVFDEEKDNREIVDILKIKLDAFKNTYVVDEELFFNSVLVEKFSQIESKYETIQNNNVDYDYLVETSREIYDEIKLLEDACITYPTIYDEANDTFKRLGELNELYSKLITQKYNLDDINFIAKYQDLVSALDDVFERLEKLDGVSELVITQTNKFVDDCYMRFEEEISAKENLNRNLATYEKNNAKLVKLISQYEVEIKEIQKYEISDEVKQRVEDALNEMNQYVNRYFNLVDFVADIKIEYSKANEDFIDVNNNIIRLCEEAQTIINFSRQTRKDEINAIKQLETLRFELNDTLLDSLLFKVNSDAVNKLFIQGKVVLKRLENQLKTDKINIDEVNNVLNDSINLLADFKICVQKELSLKNICKNTLLYANRYRSLTSQDEITLSMSERLISQGLFKRAIENIYSVINKHENVNSISDFIKTWEGR